MPTLVVVSIPPGSMLDVMRWVGLRRGRDVGSTLGAEADLVDGAPVNDCVELMVCFLLALCTLLEQLPVKPVVIRRNNVM